MAPRKIMIIRHAEKAQVIGGMGVDEHGNADEHSLAVRGWQRAGALVGYFAEPWAPGITRPDVIYATGTGPGSPSQRSIETAAPLASKLGCAFITKFAKEDSAAAMREALGQTGVVLMVWEHKMIPTLVAALHAPDVPFHWPEARFDMVWLFDRRETDWVFAQVPQCLLAGDKIQPLA